MKKVFTTTILALSFYLSFLLIPHNKPLAQNTFPSSCTGSSSWPCTCACGGNAHAVDYTECQGNFPGCMSQQCMCVTNPPSTSDLPIDWTSLFSAIRGENPEGDIGWMNVNLRIGTIISAALPYVFAIAGFLLLIMLIIAGYQYMTSEGDPKKAAAARGRLTWAIVGFIVIFAAYWVIVLIGRILDIPSDRFPFSR